MIKGLWYGLASLLIIITIIYLANNKPQNAEVKQVQKFRFGIKCQDGSMVEYISPYRLPNHLVCQPEPKDR